MKGIVGKKLGMTQVFDPETGVVTPVTVIEAAPCPVVQVKTADADGYDAVQIAYDEVAERKVTKPELGHLKKNNVKGAYRHLLELRGQSEAIVGENVTVEVFEPGEKIKVSGIAHGKGFAGNDQAAPLPSRPDLARLAQRPQAGLDRGLGHALARLQGT